MKNAYLFFLLFDSLLVGMENNSEVQRNTMEVAEVIGLLVEKRRTEACLVDEYGSFSGVVSLSKGVHSVLLPLFNQIDKHTIPAKGKVRLFSGNEEVNIMSDWLPLSLRASAPSVRTLNGLLTNYLGFIPKTGDKFAIEGCNFYIISSSPVKIESVLIRKRNDHEY